MIGLGLGPAFGGAFNWAAYWATLISATVEDAAPTKVVMTFSKANTNLVASDFTIAGKTVTLLERDVTNKILTLTVSVAFKYGDTPVITFGKTGETADVTNNVLFAFATASADLTQSYVVKLPIGKTLTIDWDDGNIIDYAGNNLVNVTVAHNYAGAGTYNIKFSGDFLSLTHLSCYSNSLTGNISSWSVLTNLIYLRCDTNSLEGDVSSWSSLTNLTYLLCDNNSLEGNVSGWSALTSLTKLTCYGNSLEGDVSGWSSLTNLTTLTCSSNSLEGDVSGWSVLTNLIYLRCDGNSLEGDVSSWSSLIRLNTLQCYNNSLTGDVSSWSALTILTYLRCNNNSLTGDVSSWSALTILTYLQCYNNSLDFDSSAAWTALNLGLNCDFSSNSMSTTQVNNALIAFAGGPFTNTTIDLSSNTGPRDSDSDAAVATLITAGCTIITNGGTEP